MRTKRLYPTSSVFTIYFVAKFGRSLEQTTISIGTIEERSLGGRFVLKAHVCQGLDCFNRSSLLFMSVPDECWFCNNLITCVKTSAHHPRSIKIKIARVSSRCLPGRIHLYYKNNYAKDLVIGKSWRTYLQTQLLHEM